MWFLISTYNSESLAVCGCMCLTFLTHEQSECSHDIWWYIVVHLDNILCETEPIGKCNIATVFSWFGPEQNKVPVWKRPKGNISPSGSLVGLEHAIIARRQPEETLGDLEDVVAATKQDMEGRVALEEVRICSAFFIYCSSLHLVEEFCLYWYRKCLIIDLKIAGLMILFLPLR